MRGRYEKTAKTIVIGGKNVIQTLGGSVKRRRKNRAGGERRKRGLVEKVLQKTYLSADLT